MPARRRGVPPQPAALARRRSNPGLARPTFPLEPQTWNDGLAAERGNRDRMISRKPAASNADPAGDGRVPLTGSVVVRNLRGGGRTLRQRMIGRHPARTRAEPSRDGRRTLAGGRRRGGRCRRRGWGRCTHRIRHPIAVHAVHAWNVARAARRRWCRCRRRARHPVTVYAMHARHVARAVRRVVSVSAARPAPSYRSRSACPARYPDSPSPVVGAAAVGAVVVSWSAYSAPNCRSRSACPARYRDRRRPLLRHHRRVGVEEHPEPETRSRTRRFPKTPLPSSSTRR